MNIRKAVIPILIPLGIAWILTSCSQSVTKPNFIMIQMDDLGWDDLGVHGNQLLETPNLDRLAGESLRFNNYYVNPVCAPSRASLLTGRHFLRTGVAHVHGGKDYLNLEEVTIAELLKEGGYATGMWGKWHSGTTQGYRPWERGFDEAYMASLYKHENSQGLLNGEPVYHQAWADEVIIDYATDFIRRNKDKPFFAYLPSMTCHEPLAAPEHIVRKYKEKGLSENLATLYAMVDFFDMQVQRLFDALDDMGLTRNTVVLFMSDNGPAINNGLFTDEDRQIRYVNHLKGHKGNIWENGVKSPLFIKWGDHLKPGIIESLADVTDILPSILELAGIEIKEENPVLDGISIVPLLRGEISEERKSKLSFNYANPGWPPTEKPWTPEGVMNEYDPITPEAKHDLKFKEQIISVKQGAYKLLLNPDVKNNGGELIDGYGLYNIGEDPGEHENLMESEPAIAAILKNELTSWFSGILRSPHSFLAPVFIIGDEATMSMIRANGSVRNSPSLKNTFMTLNDWSQVGEYAEYTIEVRTAGIYQVAANHSPVKTGATEMKISVGEQSITGALQNNNTIFGELSLETGKYVLRAEISETSGGTSEILIPSFHSLEFTLQKLAINPFPGARE